jgi:hypothetical protein
MRLIVKQYGDEEKNEKLLYTFMPNDTRQAPLSTGYSDCVSGFFVAPNGRIGEKFIQPTKRYPIKKMI